MVPDDHPLDPAVADDDVRAHAQHRHRHGRVQRLQEVRQIIGISRDEQGIGIPAHPEPGERPERLVAQKLAADPRQVAQPSPSSCPGRA
jgi:hypothetical protein